MCEFLYHNSSSSLSLVCIPTININHMQKKDPQEAEELRMQNMYGVFLVLLVGSLFSCVYGLLEWFLNIYMNSKQEKVGNNNTFFSSQNNKSLHTHSLALPFS